MENHVADSFQEQAAPVPQLWPWDGKGRMSRERAMIRSDLMLGRLLRHHPHYANTVPPAPVEIERDVAIIPTALAINAPGPRPTVKEIQQAVSDFYCIEIDDMLSQRRKKDVIYARHVAIYLAKRLTPLALQHIGRLFGHRDHSTVMNAVDSIARKRIKCERLSDDIELITLRLRHALANRSGTQ